MPDAEKVWLVEVAGMRTERLELKLAPDSEEAEDAVPVPGEKHN